MRRNRAAIVVPGSEDALYDQVLAARAWADFVESNKDKFERTMGAPMGQRLGCGLFGCVFASTSPWVVKLTRDETEGDIWSYMAELLLDEELTAQLNAFLRVYDVVRIRPDVLFGGTKMPVFGIVREEALPVLREPGLATAETVRRIGLSKEMLAEVGIREEPSLEAISEKLELFPENVRLLFLDLFRTLIGVKRYRQHALVFHAWRGRLTHKAYQGLSKEEAEEVADEAFRNMLDAIRSIRFTDGTPNVFGNELGQTLLAAVNYGDLVFQDLHLFNLGWRIHEEIDGDVRPLSMVILDPGAMATPYSPEVRQVDLLENIGRRIGAW